MSELGKNLAKNLKGGDIILLTGELGAGKTVLCKGIAAGLGVAEHIVSPTFTIMNEYFGTKIKFCHFDAYRLADAEEGIGAGLTDYLGNCECVCAVEWWKNISELFDGNMRTIKINISKTDGNVREVTIERYE